MTYKFETEEEDEARILMNAVRNDGILFELKNNFWRKWKHEPPKDYQEVLVELQKQLEEYEG